MSAENPSSSDNGQSQSTYTNSNDTNGVAVAPPSGEVPRKRRGFAAMDPKLVSELATKGGKAAHAAGTAHEFTSEEARVAGRKGGMATHARRRARTDGVNRAPNE